ncbi:DUF2059 domain-containing protein [Opitutus terrae]|uniref:DUF2059 domain-containing protein n=1 Tax=Opitutus terrae (strain DSM 11246 / JCM 15787 / PB90-1) TaxID=452637 RepID=B1ZQ91_OPITP|nr:DUF2059 domain-containing protein [Opitutus terrae]ACB73571.1 hypothetical protein Oter_0281 [Opitutus terrae PB90-1]
MKKLALALLAVLSAAAVYAADPAPVFNATFTMGKETRFILVSPAGETSGWIKLGDEFAGYTLKDFDPATATLAVERGGAVTKLTLVDDAVVKPGAPARAGTQATLADAETTLNVMRFEEMMEKMFAQQKQQSVAMVRQMTGQMNTPGVNREELAAFQEKVMGEMMAALNPAQMKQDMVKIYSELFTKEELAAQSAFYSTPAGQAMVDKTPAVQARLQQVMMPRMQAVMPKIMQMGQEFRAQQQAKAQAAGAAATPPVAPKG